MSVPHYLEPPLENPLDLATAALHVLLGALAGSSQASTAKSRTCNAVSGRLGPENHHRRLQPLAAGEANQWHCSEGGKVPPGDTDFPLRDLEALAHVPELRTWNQHFSVH